MGPRSGRACRRRMTHSASSTPASVAACHSAPPSVVTFRGAAGFGAAPSNSIVCIAIVIFRSGACGLVVSRKHRRSCGGPGCWRITATAQQRICPRCAGVIGLADLGDQPGPDLVQLAQHRVDHVQGVGGAPAGVRVGFVAGFPDRQPGTEIIDAAAGGLRGRRPRRQRSPRPSPPGETSRFPDFRKQFPGATGNESADHALQRGRGSPQRTVYGR